MEIDQSTMDKSNEDLLFELGLSIDDQSLSSKNKTRMDYVFDGLAWMAQRRSEFISLICQNSVITTLRTHHRAANRLALAGAIGDLISATCGQVPVATVAVLLAYEGLHSLCPGDCGNDGGSDTDAVTTKP